MVMNWTLDAIRGHGVCAETEPDLVSILVRLSVSLWNSGFRYTFYQTLRLSKL